MEFQVGIVESGHHVTRYTEDGPELAWVETLLIGASTAKGRNYFLDNVGFRADRRAEAEAQLAKIIKAGSTPESAPEAWREGDPTYGSDAWDSGAEYGLACFEADCYGEPRPNWF